MIIVVDNVNMSQAENDMDSNYEHQTLCNFTSTSEFQLAIMFSDGF